MPVQVPVPKNTFRLVRVFLASPGDLGEERQAARDAVEEVNKTIARPAGFHVDLIGWEDTISDRRRPQEIINEDLQTCEMFVGMMWKKWGTAPDVNGEYTSGFSEEFALANKLHDQHGWPIIRLYFKQVDDALLTDPGDDLKRVISFRKEIEDGKKVFFETFERTSEFAKKMRISVADYINRLRLENLSQELSNTSPQASPLTAQGPQQENEQSSAELAQAKFLADVATEITEKKSVPVVAVARLRNLSNVLAQSQNDELTLQAHDANIIYYNRGSLQLSPSEITSLGDAGLAAYSTDNLPQWYWISDRLAANKDWLVLSTIIGGQNTRIGAFQAMSLLGQEVPQTVLEQPREDFISQWFGDTLASQLRIEAVRYLGNFGKKEDRKYIEAELQKKNNATLTPSLESQIAHILRFEGPKSAVEFALVNSFDDLGPIAMDPVLSALTELPTNELQLGLVHRAAAVRLRTMCIMHERGDLTNEQAEALLADASLPIREKAAAVLRADAERNWSSNDLRGIFVKKGNGGVFGALGSYDWNGEAALQRFEVDQESTKAKSDLEKSIDDAKSGWFLSYLAMGKCYFRTFASTMRHDFDDLFKNRFQRHVQFIRDILPGDSSIESLVQSLLQSEKVTRRDWLRKTADILLRHNDKQDLDRLRKVLDDDEMDPSTLDIQFFGTAGGWEDLPRISKLCADFRTRGMSSSLLGSKPPTQIAANASLRIAGKRSDELLTVGFSGDLLAAVIASMTKAGFNRLGDETLLELLNSKDDAVRKATALRIVQSRNATYVRNLALRYESQGYRFYNVIRWLDLAVAFAPPVAKTAAAGEIKRLATKWS